MGSSKFPAVKILFLAVSRKANVFLFQLCKYQQETFEFLSEKLICDPLRKSFNESSSN